MSAARNQRSLVTSHYSLITVLMRAVSSVVEHLVYTNALTNTLICSHALYREKTGEWHLSHVIRNALKKCSRCNKSV
jgi:hypothetical protein